MVLRKNTNVMILTPYKSRYWLLKQDSFCSLVDSNSFTNYQSIIQFKKKYHYISASVIKNSMLDSIQIGMSQFDLIDGLGLNNSGCLIICGNDDDRHPI